MVRVSLALWLPPPPPPPLHAARDVAAATAMTAAPARTNVGRDMKTLLRRIERDIGGVDPVGHRRRHDAKYVTRISDGAIGCQQLSRPDRALIDGVISGDLPGRSGVSSPGSRGRSDDAVRVTGPSGPLPTNGRQLWCAPHPGRSAVAVNTERWFGVDGTS